MFWAALLKAGSTVYFCVQPEQTKSHIPICNWMIIAVAINWLIIYYNVPLCACACMHVHVHAYVRIMYTHRLSTACMEMKRAGTLNVSKKISAAFSRFLLGFSGASVSSTGCYRKNKKLKLFVGMSQFSCDQKNNKEQHQNTTAIDEQRAGKSKS